MVKESLCQENIAILNMYVSNNRARKCVKRKLIKLKEEIDKSTFIVGDFNTLLSTTCRTTKQKNRKDIEELNIKQQNLIDIYRTLQPIAAKYIIFKSQRMSILRYVIY